ncbi:uncharacterized protein [Nicotiana sylvestris]|uniref:uncharacterized protein n=1 Tax=Nicotiana sylvestris TaxID=4096 RepID=UPI00388CA1C8
MEDIFKIKQGDSEHLREFVDRFQRERMMLRRVPDNWAAMTFASNLNEKSSEATRRLKESLHEFPATTWNDVYNRYNTKLRIEEDTISQSQKEEKVSSRRAETDKRSSKNRYEPYMGPAGRESRSKQDNSRYDHISRDRESGSSSKFGKDQNARETRDDDRSLKAKFGGYNFNVSTSELVAVLRNMGDKVRCPKEMRSNPNRRNPDHWCEFHNDHGHKTTDCTLLQGEVDHLLKQGYLTKLFRKKGKQAYIKNMQESPKPPSPKRTANIISGGEEINGVTYTITKKISKFTVTHGKRVRHVLEEESITFDDADADGVLTPHNNALIISLLIHNTNVKRVLIDPSSSVNIILLSVLNEMQAEDRMVPKAHTLSGFDNSSVVTKGEVLLTIFAEGVFKDAKFQVVEMDMTYNMILGRPWIHKMDVVPSTLHQFIKFPSPWGIRQICRDQQTSRSINSVADSSTKMKKYSNYKIQLRILNMGKQT